jgi:hypothetical protein
MAYLSTTLKAQLRIHFSYTCAYCHSPEFLSNAIFEFDHIVPEASGGDSTFEIFASVVLNATAISVKPLRT